MRIKRELPTKTPIERIFEEVVGRKMTLREKRILLPNTVVNLKRARY
jgi:hypothetical protein